jgi:hypothetical protein
MANAFADNNEYGEIHVGHEKHNSRAGLLVTHYLCVKCGELLMKVVWQAKMIMVWRLSCNQL